MLIYFFYQIILIIGDSFLLGIFELRDDFLHVFSVDSKFQDEDLTETLYWIIDMNAEWRL